MVSLYVFFVLGCEYNVSMLCDVSACQVLFRWKAAAASVSYLNSLHC